jgi:hypothetical protein
MNEKGVSMERGPQDEKNVADPRELTCSVGERASPDGQTVAVLSTEGALLVSQHGGEYGRKSADAEVSPQTAHELFERAARFDWRAEFPPRPGIPGEAIVEWTLRGGDGSESTVRAWIHDAEKDDLMGPVLRELRAAVERASKGELYL